MVVTYQDGVTIDYPVNAEFHRVTGEVARGTIIGSWQRWRKPGRPLEPNELLDRDVLSLLTDAAMQFSTLTETDGELTAHSPVGLLGSAAMTDDRGQPKRFAVIPNRLWDAKLGGFLLPAVPHDGAFRCGNAMFGPLVEGGMARTGTRNDRFRRDEVTSFV